MRFVALLFGLLLLSGCATTGAHKISAMPQGQRVAVVSALGDRMTARYVGTLAFENSETHIPVPGWAIDGFVESQIEQRLQPWGRWKLVACEPDRAAINRSVAEFHSAFTDTNLEVVRLVRTACDADLYLVVLPAEVELIPSDASTIVAGYGLRQRGFLGMKATVAFTNLWLFAFGPSGDDEIGRTLLREFVVAPNEWLPASGGLSSVGEQGARALVEKLLKEHLPELLGEMKLI